MKSIIETEGFKVLVDEMTSHPERFDGFVFGVLRASKDSDEQEHHETVIHGMSDTLMAISKNSQRTVLEAVIGKDNLNAAVDAIRAAVEGCDDPECEEHGFAARMRTDQAIN